MSVTPGNDGGDCPRCGATTTQVGYGGSVVAALCEGCDLLMSLSAEAMTVSEATNTDWSDWEPVEGTSWGPDPWG